MKKLLSTLYNNLFKKNPILTDGTISDDSLFDFLDSPKPHAVESLEGWSGTLREQILEFYDKDDPVWIANVEQSISKIKYYLNEVENELR